MIAELDTPKGPPTADPERADAAHNVASWIEHWARVDGDHPALRFDGTTSSYSDLADAIARLAQIFLDQGIKLGDRVAVLLENHPAYLHAVFASARIGAIAIPINTRLAPAELRFILEDAEPGLILVDEASAALLDRLESDSDTEPPARLLVPATAAAWGTRLAASAAHKGPLAARPDDPMMLMYSSGTTGTPKGALLPHRKALYNSLNAEGCFAITRSDRCLVVAPLFHSLGLHILSIPVFHAGACVVLLAGFDAEEVLDAMAHDDITYMGGVPTHYERMLTELKKPDAQHLDLSKVRFLFGAGAAVAPDTIRGFAEFDLVLKQGYGQTETSMLCCLEEEDALRKAGSVGRPLEHLELRVVRPHTLSNSTAEWRDVSASKNEDEDAEIGEIVVRGPITMLSYWRDEAGTRETLRDGWVLTGDLARIDPEGFITLVGRSREMFISGGENVYPAEIEAAYLKHPEIREIAVVGVPDPKWGEVGRAYVAMEASGDANTEALRDWGRELLASFKIPTSFVRVDQLPKTASGKVQKHRLAAANRLDPT